MTAWTRAQSRVVVLTFNEERNLRACLESVDGLGTDSLRRRFGQHRRDAGHCATHRRDGASCTRSRRMRGSGSGRSRTLPIRDGLGAGARRRSAGHARTCGRDRRARREPIPADADGFYVNRRQIFRGRWIRHGGYYPKYLLKLFRRDAVSVDETRTGRSPLPASPDATECCRHDIVEDNRNEASIADWIAKHNRYAVLQARQERARARTADGRAPSALFGTPDERTRVAEARLEPPAAVHAALRCISFYRYVCGSGFSTASEGFVFHVLQAFWYRLLVDINIDELRRTGVQDAAREVNHRTFASASTPTTATSRRCSSATASSSPRSKKSASAASSTSPAFRTQAIRACLEMGGVDGRRRRSRRACRAIRARTCGARRCSRCATGPTAALVRDRAANYRQRQRAFPTPSPRRSVWPPARSRPARALGRAPSGAPGERVLRLAVRRGGGVRDRRVRRLRQHVVGGRARASTLDVDRAHVLPALARRCSISRSRSTSGSRSTATSSRSWASRRTASRDFVERDSASWCSCGRAAGSSSTSSYFQHWSGGARHDVGRRRADARARCSRRSSKRCSGRRAGADEPVDAAARSDRRVAAGGLRGGRLPRAATACTRAPKLPRLCLAGGCAMNSVANGKIRERTPFTDVYIQPASGDNGTALGAAFYVWNQMLGQPRGFVMTHGYWGPSFDDRRDRRGARRAQPTICDAQGCDGRDASTTTSALVRLDRRAHRRRPGRRLVPGADGVGRARARQPQHPRRSAPRRHARDHQHARSSSARSSGRSRRRCSKRRTTSTSSAPCPTRS